MPYKTSLVFWEWSVLELEKQSQPVMDTYTWKPYLAVCWLLLAAPTRGLLCRFASPPRRPPPLQKPLQRQLLARTVALEGGCRYWMALSSGSVENCRHHRSNCIVRGQCTSQERKEKVSETVQGCPPIKDIGRSVGSEGGEDSERSEGRKSRVQCAVRAGCTSTHTSQAWHALMGANGQRQALLKTITAQLLGPRESNRIKVVLKKRDHPHIIRAWQPPTWDLCHSGRRALQPVHHPVHGIKLLVN